MTKTTQDGHVRIRPLCAADHDNWAELWNHYLAFYDIDLPQDIYETTFERLIAEDQSRMQANVAECDGEIVGLVHFILHDHCWRKGQVCYMQDLFTHPDHRGAGIGQALIESVYADADRLGAESTYWLTQTFNERARKLYDRVAHVTAFIKYQRA